MSNKKRLRHGRYWLAEPTDKYKTFGVCWVENRQTRRLTLGTSDRAEAEEAFGKYTLERDTAKAKDEPAAQSLARYQVQWASKIASADVANRAIADALEVFTNDKGEPAMVSECGAVLQKRLIQRLRARGLAEDSIYRWLTPIWAAFNHAALNEHIQKSVIPARLPQKKWDPRTEPRRLRSSSSSRRPLEPEEMGAMLDAAQEPEYEHVLRWQIWQIGMGLRPERVREVTTAQVNLKYGIVDLNEPGRVQNNKNRPILPMPPTLLKWVIHWGAGMTPQGHYLGYRGQPLATEQCIRDVIERAGIRNCVPYSWRHTAGAWLAAQAVDRWERLKFTAHAAPDGGSMDEYTHYDPKYLRNASNAMERLYEAVAPFTCVNLLRREHDEEEPLPETIIHRGRVYALRPRTERLVGADGIEPPTACMSRRSSTTELRANPETVSRNATQTDAEALGEVSAWQARGTKTHDSYQNQSLSPVKSLHVKDNKEEDLDIKSKS